MVLLSQEQEQEHSPQASGGARAAMRAVGHGAPHVAVAAALAVGQRREVGGGARTGGQQEANRFCVVEPIAGHRRVVTAAVLLGHVRGTAAGWQVTEHKLIKPFRRQVRPLTIGYLLQPRQPRRALLEPNHTHSSCDSPCALLVVGEWVAGRPLVATVWARLRGRNFWGRPNSDPDSSLQQAMA